MGKLVIALICLFISACDFTVPLSGKPELLIDERAVGLWERTKEDGKTERMLVLPISEHEYFLSWPEAAPTELYAKAHLFEFSDRTLVQLKWFGNSNGTVPDNDVVWQVAAYSIAEDTLEVRLLNPDVTGKDHKTTAELALAVESNMNNPLLFRDNWVFKKIHKSE